MVREIFKYIHKSKLNIIYEYTMIILALIVVSILFIELVFDLSESTRLALNKIDTLVLVIFAVDYFIRFAIADNKKNYIVNHKADLMAIIPFSSIFRVFRIARIARVAQVNRFNRLVRGGAWLSRFKDSFLIFIKTNGLIYIALVTTIMVLLGALGIIIFEEINFLDAIWWSFVTTTTVGYGDISPESLGGRIVAATLMLVGIGFISMLTGTIATFFIKDNSDSKTYKDEVIIDIKNKLNDFDNISIGDLEEMFTILKSLKEKK